MLRYSPGTISAVVTVDSLEPKVSVVGVAGSSDVFGVTFRVDLVCKTVGLSEMDVIWGTVVRKVSCPTSDLPVVTLSVSVPYK